MKKRYSPYYEEAGEGAEGAPSSLGAGSLNPTDGGNLAGAPAPTPTVGWKESLSVSDDVRGWRGLENVKDPSDAVTQLYNANKLIGVDMMAQPQEGWTEDQWGEHYTSLGRPAESKDYAYPELSDEQSANFEMSELEVMKEPFHKAGLTQAQVSTVMEGYLNAAFDSDDVSAEASQAEHLANTAEMVAKYGDLYEGKLNIAQQAAKQYGMAQLLTDHGLDGNPAFIEAFIKIGEATMESSPRDGVASFNVSSVATAQHAITAFQSNSDKIAALHSSANPGHEAAKAEWLQLHEVAFPAGS